MQKRITLAALATAIALVGASDVLAQRTGAWKPHYGGGAGGGGSSSAGRSYAPSFNYARPVQPAQPMIAQEPGYRTFSIEPLGISAHDNVVVNRNNARLMLGRNVVATLPQGIEFQVTRVVNGWLGAVVNLDGQEHKGWIWNGDVQLSDRGVPTPPAG
jgi:hypothetical protein